MRPFRWAWLASAELVVDIFEVDCLAMHAADPALGALDVGLRIVHEAVAHHLVLSRGRIVPVHLLRGDIVSAHEPARQRRLVDLAQRILGLSMGR